MRKNVPVIKAFITLLLVSALVFGLFLIIRQIFFTPPEPKTIDYNGTQIVVSEKVPKNELDPEKFYSENGRTYYRDPLAQYGVDVSSHQGVIDWAKVKADGIDFAIIRCGYRGWGEEGKINEDEYFRQNIEGALQNGLDVGVYFFSQAITEDEAREEARFVLDLIRGYKITYPVIYDWEHISGVEAARTYDYAHLDVSAFANAFCSEVASVGYNSTVYFNPSYGYLIYDIEEISEHKFWLAHYGEKPEFYYGFSIWQYTNSGTVDGIEKTVDINISFIDYYK